MSDLRFSDLSLHEKTLEALDAMGYTTPTPVQAAAIPMVATGRDLMVQSQTGTGKTAAFGIPLVERLGDRPQGVQALILVPTRELAKQVADELCLLGKLRRVQTVAVYGGSSLEKQVAEMRFAHVVVGTPGRVLDHLGRGTLRLAQLRSLVLDEADEMLSMGFARELSLIMEHIPEERQTLLFSATIPEDIKRYAQRYMRSPEFLSLVEANIGADDVEHHYYMVSGVGRPRDLVQVLEYEDPESALIFTNTRKDSELVARFLKRQGYDVDYLNSDLPQGERERLMQRIKEKSLRFLVATDIAARGIDISELSHVVNFILPESPESYIHRTGRTGRAGHKGTAISLIGPREIGVYYYLKRIYKVALKERPVPTQAEIELRRDERKTEGLVKEILEAVGTAPDAATPDLRDQTMRLLERDDAVEIVQALLRAFRAGGIVKRGTSAGGVLQEIPKPGRLAPGARAQTLEGVAERVAIVQSEFRGLPGGQARKERTPVVAPKPAIEIETTSPVVEDEAPVARPPWRPIAPAVVPPPPAPTPPRAEDEPTRRSWRHEEPRTTDDDEPNQPRRRRRRLGEAVVLSEPAIVTVPTPKPAPAVYEEDEDEDDGPVLKRLFVNMGKRENVTEEQLREQLSELAGLMPEDLAVVEVFGRHSYISLAPEYAQDLIEAVDGETLNGRIIRIEYAREEN